MKPKPKYEMLETVEYKIEDPIHKKIFEKDTLAGEIIKIEACFYYDREERKFLGFWYVMTTPAEDGYTIGVFENQIIGKVS